MKKSSRFAFHLINETKARVKISEGSYENNGNLQALPMERAFNSLKSFLSISKSLKSRKIICVATSAMRDAPNSKEFVNRVKNELGLNIKVIDGSKEAFFGGVATLNLIDSQNFITIDIGGGSTEFAIVKNGKIEHVQSLDVGTVRLNELFFRKEDISGAKDFILKKLQELQDNYKNDIPQTVIGIGGSIRALSKIVQKSSYYPLDVLHGFTYDPNENKDIFRNIIKASENSELKVIGVKKERFDTIKEGTLIFQTVLKELNTSKVITSGVGVREGVYLADLLRNSNCKFPSNFNVSVRSLLDRFEVDSKLSSYNGANAGKIFDVLAPIHNLDNKYRKLLVVASKLHSIGNSLNFYKGNDNTADFILNGLNYDYSHASRVLVAHIIKFSKKSIPSQKDLDEYKKLLPSLEIMQWLSFMISLNLTLNQDFSNPKIEYSLENGVLEISLEEDIYMVRSEADKLQMPNNIEIKII